MACPAWKSTGLSPILPSSLSFNITFIYNLLSLVSESIGQQVILYQSINGCKYILFNSLYFNVIDKVFPQYLQLDVVFVGPGLIHCHSLTHCLKWSLMLLNKRYVPAQWVKTPMQYLVTILFLILLLTLILTMWFVHFYMHLNKENLWLNRTEKNCDQHVFSKKRLKMQQGWDIAGGTGRKRP